MKTLTPQHESCGQSWSRRLQYKTRRFEDCWHISNTYLVEKTWHTLRTKLRVVKENIGSWQHAGERCRREQVCLTKLRIGHVVWHCCTCYNLKNNGQYVYVAEHSHYNTLDSQNNYRALRRRCGVRGDLKTDLADETTSTERTLCS